MRTLDIDLINLWIADMNEMRFLLQTCGIEPGYGELQPLSYPA
jgi:hypothetical protein